MTRATENLSSKTVGEIVSLSDPYNALGDNPLRTRADLQAAVVALFAPLRPHFSPGGARVRLGASSLSRKGELLRTGLLVVSPYTGLFAKSLVQKLVGSRKARSWQSTLRRPSELEGFARPLWGLVPLVAGGGNFDDWALYRRGLANGTNPSHAEYWGGRLDKSQMLVEMAAVGFALALVPEHLWDPLAPQVQKNVVRWLNVINQVEVADNNWLFFRVLVNLGLARVGARHDAGASKRALSRLETFYLGDGWYSDGPKPQLDHYVAFGMHYYALLYAQLAEPTDPERAQRFRERAAMFAQDYVHWFAEAGDALPFGRSLTYRFAQGAFWGALAFAGIEALPWPVLKGLMLRHLRWWARQPIFDKDGLLTLGYTYPNKGMAESYSSPASPYWALKLFLPLALSASHPFWEAKEAPLPALEPVSVQRQPGLVLCNDAEHAHVFALGSRQHAPLWLNHGGAKYAKFAYSSSFGFGIPARRSEQGHRLSEGAFDSTLALSLDGRFYKARERVLEFRLDVEILYTRWSLWADVMVETWLLPLFPWHVRVHSMTTSVRLYSAEGGFAFPCDESSTPPQDFEAGRVIVSTETSCSGLRSMVADARRGAVVRAEPKTNLIHLNTVIPTLKSSHEPGGHWLSCAVLGLPQTTAAELECLWREPPTIAFANDRPSVYYRGRSFNLTS